MTRDTRVRALLPTWRSLSEAEKVKALRDAVFKAWTTMPPGPDRDAYLAASNLLREVRSDFPCIQ